jgi:hypothetical protein
MSGVFVLSPEQTNKHPSEWELAVAFEESIHGRIFGGFFDSTLDPIDWPQLRRMSDWYGEAHYQGNDLSALIGELNRMIPRLPVGSAQKKALKRVLQVCRYAGEDSRGAAWLGD